MKGIKPGDAYRQCEHLETNGALTRHWWGNPSGWLALCPACHRNYQAKKPVKTASARHVFGSEQQKTKLTLGFIKR